MATPEKEHPYRDTPYIEKIKETLTLFGYKRLEAKELSRNIAQNLDNYSRILDMVEAQRRSRLGGTSVTNI